MAQLLALLLVNAQVIGDPRGAHPAGVLPIVSAMNARDSYGKRAKKHPRRGDGAGGGAGQEGTTDNGGRCPHGCFGGGESAPSGPGPGAEPGRGTALGPGPDPGLFASRPVTLWLS